MRYFRGELIFSASDLIGFLGCRHATFLDRHDLDNPAPPVPDDPHLELLQKKGVEHEGAFLERLRGDGRSIVAIATKGSLEEKVAATRRAMEAGADVIYQAALRQGRWYGYADFLLRVAGGSTLGDYHYEPLDTKLAR